MIILCCACPFKSHNVRVCCVVDHTATCLDHRHLDMNEKKHLVSSLEQLINGALLRIDECKIERSETQQTTVKLANVCWELNVFYPPG